MTRVEPAVPCGRGPAECGGTAEPEEDGPVTYWACTACGYESGFTVTGTPPGGDCQLGLPEQTRRRAARPVFLGPAIARRQA